MRSKKVHTRKTRKLVNILSDRYALSLPSIPTSVHDGEVDAELLENLSHDLACWLTHPPSHIRLDRLAVTTHCSAPSSPLVVECGRVGEASSFLAEGAGEPGA